MASSPCAEHICRLACSHANLSGNSHLEPARNTSKCGDARQPVWFAEDAALHGSATNCESAEHSSEPVICARAGLAGGWGGSGYLLPGNIQGGNGGDGGLSGQGGNADNHGQGESNTGTNLGGKAGLKYHNPENHTVRLCSEQADTGCTWQ